MTFRNRIRLPFYITRPQFPTTRKVFSLANGETKTTSVVVRKVYDAVVDYMPAELHERLQIALSHDVVNIEGEKYIGGIYEDGDYEIQWTEFLDFPIGQATFKAAVTPYNFSNFNCQTCEEALQLNLSDDYITGVYDTIAESSVIHFNVFENDDICCSPAIASIISINSLYVLSASIDSGTGIITINLKPETPSGNNINLCNYRVTCPNGSYDDASVYCNVSGTLVLCQQPDFVDPGTITETSASPNWDWTLGAPPNVGSFNYALYEASNPGVPIDSGNTTDFSVIYNTLNPGTCYIFSVQTVCDDLSTSDFISINFCTPVSTARCGRYNVFWTDGSGTPGGDIHIFNYMTCSGHVQNDFITNLQYKLICTLENSPGDPVQILGVTSYERVEDCF